MLVACAVCPGCITGPSSTISGPIATDIDPQTAKSDYWFDQPGTVQVVGRDFDKLWGATEEAARHRFFFLDRVDYRDGLLTTAPALSEQFFEPWRGDALTMRDVGMSSLQSIRRTVHFEFVRRGDGAYVMTPKVLVERASFEEQHLSSSVEFRNAVAPAAYPRAAETYNPNAPPLVYWYSIGRDAALEQALADDVHHAL
jgi:hypothetical protein